MRACHVAGGLTEVSDSTLDRLRVGIENGTLRAPLIRADLTAFGVTQQLDVLLGALEGYSRAACLSLLGSVIAERKKYDRPPPELVWTGPEAASAVARDTAVVSCSLHAKCVAVDGARAFVSSANFTGGQERNIEAGVLLYDSTCSRGTPRHRCIDP